MNVQSVDDLRTLNPRSAVDFVVGVTGTDCN
jgi:hypothetical protein